MGPEENTPESIDEKIKRFLERQGVKPDENKEDSPAVSKPEVKEKTEHLKEELGEKKEDPQIEVKLMRLKAIADAFLVLSPQERLARFELLNTEDRLWLSKMLPQKIVDELSNVHPEIKQYVSKSLGE